MARSIPAHRPLSFVSCWLLATLATATAAHAGASPPTFSKAFSPSTIGPGSVSTLSFTIANTDPFTPVTDLAFSDSLPVGVTLATPASAATSCIGATLTAPAGGSTITFLGGSLGASSSCTVSVNVTSAAVGTHMNVSGALTSSLGNSGTASADLTVATDRPGFSKSFAPASVGLGGRSTLTLTIDNTANASPVFSLGFSDTLPAGIVVAGPANATTTCTGGTLSATAGGSVISYAAGMLAATSVCTVAVDVIGASAGVLVNTSGELSSSIGGPLRSSGKATAALSMVVGTVAISKTFTDDPVPPGGTVELEFTITNLDRNFDATAITFTDDLDATLSGLVAVGLPAANVCGPGSSLGGTGLLTLTGGNLAADGGRCTFGVSLQVPAGATAGGYPNTTSALSASLGGSPFVGPPASETLFVSAAPSLSKTFLTNPVGAGQTVTLEFTLGNNSTTSAATAITFRDNLDAFLNGVVVAALPAAGFCGAGSTITSTLIGVDRHLIVSGANLAAAGACTFSVDLTIPAGTSGGASLNTTEGLSATVDGVTQLGRPAADTLTVASAPSLRKEFTDDPVLPGGTVTLEFTLEHPETALTDVTAITFTDDLTATLAGLAAIGLPMNDVCGAGSVLSGTTTLTLSGGILMPGDVCTFGVTLQVPAGALPGSYTNTTSSVMATVSGVTTTGNGAGDVLLVAGLSIAKEFTDDPVIPGATVTLEFTLENSSPTDDATAIGFTDNVDAALSGLVAVGLPINDVCGVGSQISGTSLLTFTGGNLLAGTSCTFSVTLQVPAGAADGVYSNTTSNLSATIDGSPVVLPPASDTLTVSSRLLLLTKTFTDDPVPPGGTVTLEFTLTNLDPAQPATAVALTDDLDAALAGLVAVGLPIADVCGVGSQISGTSLLSLTGGELAAAGACTFSVTLQVPIAVPFGTVITNTTSMVTGTIGGLGVSGDPASDELRIEALTFSKTFDAPATPGGTAVLSFFIENLSVSTVVADLAFLDDLDAVLPGLVAVGLPSNDVCGAGSVLSGTSLLSLDGGSLLPGGSCSIVVMLQVPAAAVPGTYPNTTSDLLQGGLPAAGPASATLAVIESVLFAKSFQSAPVLPGGLVELEYTITNPSAFAGVVSLSFSDDLGAVITGLAAVGLPSSDVCGTGSQLAGTTVLSLSGGNLPPGGACTFSALVQVPAGAPLGIFTSTSSPLTFSLAPPLPGGTAQTGPAAADLEVEFLAFSKVFDPGPFQAGEVAALTFMISNPDPVNTASGITFSDDLAAVLPGLAAIGLPIAGVCGAGSQIGGTSLLTLSGGTLGPSESCVFAVMVQIPGDAAEGTYTNLTSGLEAVVGGSAVVGGPASVATADLQVGFSAIVIPTLDVWGLAALIGLLLVVGLRRLRVG